MSNKKRPSGPVFLFRILPLFAAVLTAVSSFYGCSSEEERLQKPLVKINGESVITLGQYRDAIKRVLPPDSGEEATGLKKELLSRLIEEEIILSEAMKNGIAVSENELASEVDGIKKQYNDESFQEAIMERYGHIGNWKEEIRRKLVIRKAIERFAGEPVDISEGEAKRYYEEHMEEYDAPERVRARMIVVSSEEAAKEVAGRVNKANFAELAKEVSLSPEGKEGGDLGYFSRGEMPEEFENVVFKLKPGGISPVVKTEYGYHIFLLEDKKAAGRLKYNEVRDKIIQRLRNEAAERLFEEWVSSLKQNAQIEVREDLL